MDARYLIVKELLGFSIDGDNIPPVEELNEAIDSLVNNDYFYDLVEFVYEKETAKVKDLVALKKVTENRYDLLNMENDLLNIVEGPRPKSLKINNF